MSYGTCWCTSLHISNYIYANTECIRYVPTAINSDKVQILLFHWCTVSEKCSGLFIAWDSESSLWSDCKCTHMQTHTHTITLTRNRKQIETYDTRSDNIFNKIKYLYAAHLRTVNVSLIQFFSFWMIAVVEW